MSRHRPHLRRIPRATRTSRTESRADGRARGVLLAGSLAIALVWSPLAHADTDPVRSAQAETLYQEAVDLMDHGRVADACPKLEESERLDPGVGTEFRLADCYEKTGRTASAWGRFVELQGKVTKPDQLDKVRARAAALEPKLSRVKIVVTPEQAALPGLAIERDGVVLGRASWNAAAPVDPGPHTVRVVAQGMKPWDTSVDASKPGATIEVTIPALESGSATTAPSGKTQRTAAIVVGATGVASLGIGIALAVVASARWSDAEEACPEKVNCSAAAHDTSVEALSLSHGSTATFIIGGAAVATAIVVWFTAPKARAQTRAAWWIAPAAGENAGGLTVGGAF